MSQAESDEELLLAILNSTPVVAGTPMDQLGDVASARVLLASFGATGSAAELRHVLHARDALQAVVRGQQPADILAPMLHGATRNPKIVGGEIAWKLHTPSDRALAVRAIVAWDELNKRSPGRLRPCTNDECRLFLIDHSNGNAARWCSMAVCGNRMKARRHHQRVKDSPRS